MATRHVVVAAAVALAVGHAAARGNWINVKTGAPLTPGVYGRIEVHGSPPPLISPRPLVAKPALGPAPGAPLYFYLPAGQVRKWATWCQRYGACERPVYFVRVDNGPGRLGRWNAREQALQRHVALPALDGAAH
jgi:hypothetical protein